MLVFSRFGEYSSNSFIESEREVIDLLMRERIFILKKLKQRLIIQ
jgi:hypothetical protein